MPESAIPLLGFAGYSGSGKTTLMRRVIGLLKARGLVVGVIKHTHHEFDIDQPGKDSHALREAGARRVAVGSSRRWALIVERPEPREATLAELLTSMDDPALDLILVEGFRDEQYPKIEVHRPSLGRPLLAARDRSVLAIATDDAALDTLGLPRLDLNNPVAIEHFVHHYLESRRRPARSS